MMLTLVRPSELREARWSEGDTQAGQWIIPAERMKTSFGTTCLSHHRRGSCLTCSSSWVNQRRSSAASLINARMNPPAPGPSSQWTLQHRPVLWEWFRP